MSNNIVFPLFVDGRYLEAHPGVDLERDEQSDRESLRTRVAQSGFTKVNIKDNPRQAANREILKLLSQAVEEQPDARFWQLLFKLGIVNTVIVGTGVNQMQMVQNDYQKESKMILMMVKQRMKK